MYTCRNCKEKCNASNSRPCGKDLEDRKEVVCANNERNLQRRVTKRKAEDPRHQLVVWFAGMQKSEEQKTQYYRNMKQRKANQSLSDEQIIVMSQQTKKTGIEQRLRLEHESYATVKEDNPNLSASDVEKKSITEIFQHQKEQHRLSKEPSGS